MTERLSPALDPTEAELEIGAFVAVLIAAGRDDGNRARPADKLTF